MKSPCFLFLLFILIYSSAAFSQLIVTPNTNADSLAAQLAGPSIIVYNAQLNCKGDTVAPSSPCGTFDGSSSNLGINSGILLTTGDISNAIGPNVNSAITMNNNTQFNDPDLMIIEPSAINDVCILEFMAKPSCDSIYVKFVFGSDEYPEFVTSTFNDAFGIFVTGPNPIGPAYLNYNMTYIPNTTTPVSINTVNNGTVCPTTGPCVNCAYYIDNCGGATIEYDGFTSVITKTLQVVPYQPYKFKFAIADATDHAFDSGVFFGLGSFSCLGGVGVSQTFAGVSSLLSPNPMQQSATLTLQGLGPGVGETSLSVANVFGQEVWSLSSRYGKFLIDRSGLASGIYFYSVRAGVEIISRGKFVVE